MKRITLILTLMLCAVTVAAQSRNYNSRKAGIITITGDKEVERLVEKHVAFNEMLNTIPGYRIQIASLSGPNSKQQAFSLKERFLSVFPELQVYIIFDEPNFKIKVGDFRTRLEAYARLQDIKGFYSGHIIQDNINFRPIDTDNMVPETDEDAVY